MPEIKWVSKKDFIKIFPNMSDMAKEGATFKLSNRKEKLGIFREPKLVIDAIRMIRDMNRV